MVEFYLINITRNNNPLFFYHKNEIEEKNHCDLMPCELDSMDCMLYEIAKSDYKFITLENGFLLKKKKEYVHNKKKYEFSFVEAYYMNRTGPKSLEVVKKKLTTHINKFEKILKESMFDIQFTKEKKQEFKIYLLTQ
jgi:imidazoleglycerol phosphate synthase glutamine amidotransferase subunit HisH